MGKQNTRLKWVFMLLALSIAIGACSAGSEQEQKFAKVFSDINKDWQLYEVEAKGGNTIIRVEVSDNVSFKAGKNAMEELQKIDPKLKGFIEFYNAKVGIVLRKVELIPLT